MLLKFRFLYIAPCPMQLVWTLAVHWCASKFSSPSPSLESNPLLAVVPARRRRCVAILLPATFPHQCGRNKVRWPVFTWGCSHSIVRFCSGRVDLADWQGDVDTVLVLVEAHQPEHRPSCQFQGLLAIGACALLRAFAWSYHSYF